MYDYHKLTPQQKLELVQERLKKGFDTHLKLYIKH